MPQDRPTHCIEVDFEGFERQEQHAWAYLTVDVRRRARAAAPAVIDITDMEDSDSEEATIDMTMG